MTKRSAENPWGLSPAEMKLLEASGPAKPAAKQAKRISKQQLNKLEEIAETLELRGKGALVVGTVPRPVVRNHLPLLHPASDYLVHTTRDGNCEMTVTADARYGMPFGRDPLVQLWLFSEAVRQKNRTIRFRSGREMLQSMGLKESTYNKRWARDALKRSFGATWEVVIKHSVGEGRHQEELRSFRLTSGHSLWFDDKTRQLVLDSGENSITLSEEAYALALKKGYQAHFEIKTVAALSSIPGAMRLFLILRDRCSVLTEDHGWIPITGPTGLDTQLGVAPYANQRLWRQTLREWLEEIKERWPECPTEIHEGRRDGHYRLMITPAEPVQQKIGIDSSPMLYSEG